MSALEYMLLDQLSSKKTYITSYPKLSEDDIGGCDSNNDSGYSEKKAFVIENEIANWKKNNFDISDKSVKIVSLSRERSLNRKHSASQTEPPDGVDFDWDLTDKFDSETQTRQSSSNWSDDATVQTDQRIVFHNKGKKVSFQSSGVGSSAKSRSASKHSWSQTKFQDSQDKECQVKPADFGPVPKNQKWRKNHRRHHNHHHHITRVNLIADKAKKPTVSRKSNNVVSFNLDDDIEGPAITHKSSLAVHKARLNNNPNLEMSSHAGVQTDHDPQSSASHHSFKSDLYTEDPTFFHEVDVHVIEEVSMRWYKSVKKLVRHIQEVIDAVPEYGDRSDLVTVRGIFIWVAENIRFDHSLSEKNLTTLDILRDKAGTRKDFVKIFTDLCQVAEIKFKIITGFIKDDNYHPGERFDKRKSPLESWVAVFIENDWLLVDPLLGAGEYSEETEEYIPAVTDHYFLTDPSEFLFTHFPHSNLKPDSEYSKWQLVSSPKSLAKFNSRPVLGSEFFTLGCSLLPRISLPLESEHIVEFAIQAPEILSYKHKMYPVLDIESNEYNNYCLCTTENTNRNLATFTIVAPEVGQYYLKLYAIPEEELAEEEGGVFNFLATFLISFTKVRHNVKPWPISSQPFGLTSSYQDLGVRMVIKDPAVWEDDRIVLFVGNKAIFKYVHQEGPILSALHIYDHMGNELMEELDKSGISTLYFLSKKTPIKKEEIKIRIKKGELKPFVTKEDKKGETLFTVVAPPNVGFYKLEVYGSKVPKKHGMLHLPLVAIYLVEVRLRNSTDDVGASLRSVRSVTRSLKIEHF